MPNVPDQAWPKLKTRTPDSGPAGKFASPVGGGCSGRASQFAARVAPSASLGAGLRSRHGDGLRRAGAPPARTLRPSIVVLTKKSRATNCSLRVRSSTSCTTPMTQRSFANAWKTSQRLSFGSVSARPWTTSRRSWEWRPMSGMSSGRAPIFGRLQTFIASCQLWKSARPKFIWPSARSHSGPGVPRGRPPPDPATRGLGTRRPRPTDARSGRMPRVR